MRTLQSIILTQMSYGTLLRPKPVVSYKHNPYREVFILELIGKLKQKAENAAGKKEVRELIEEAGVKLTDEELEQVSGGYERLVVKDIVKQI